MDWSDAEDAIRSHIEQQWAVGSFADVPLVFENDPEGTSDRNSGFVFVAIEGTFAEKTIFGSPGARVSIEAGIVFIHCFMPIARGKRRATAPVVALTRMLEVQTIASVINFEGGNPPSPAHFGIAELDREIPNMQPEGNWYRVSGSVPFIVIGTI